jgi:hypothetical protein
MRAEPPHAAYRAGRALRWLAARWAWWLRAALAVWLISALTPAQARLPVEAPQTVQTQHPILCVHTRLTDEVEDWKVYRSLALARELGATAVVDLFPWAYIQPAREVFDWAHPDRIIGMAQQHGLRVIARLGIVPAWARPDPRAQPTSLNYLPPERYADYAAFAAAFAARYRGVVWQIVPWNEPNLYFEWGFRRVGPAEYVEFLKQVYGAIKAANPEVEVLGGALAPTLAPPDHPDGLDDLLYLRGIYEAGGAPHFDALAVHTYGFTAPEDEPPAPDRLNFRRAELLMQIMAEHGDGAKPVYITESSWNDHPRWLNGVQPGQRVAWTLDGLARAERDWPQVRNLCWWFLRAPTLYRSYVDYFAFVTIEFRPRPIYDAVRAWARGEAQ